MEGSNANKEYDNKCIQCEKVVFFHGDMTSKNKYIQIWSHEVQFDLFIKQNEYFLRQ